MDRPPTEATLTTTPPCSAIHAVQHFWVHSSGPVRLTWMVFSQRARSTSIVGPAYGLVAALFTRTSTAPNCSSVPSTTRSMSSGLPALPAIQAAPWPISAAACSHTSALRLLIMTLAPASA